MKNIEVKNINEVKKIMKLKKYLHAQKHSTHPLRKIMPLNSMNKPGRHCAKCNKQNIESKKLHDLI